jgi:pimeloyl-ACP methyl ester carboxylesterase
MLYGRGMTTLRVPNANLHYETRGDGPLLLISQSGEGNAERSKGLVDQLVDGFTVVTDDRRGLSRSTIDADAPPLTMATHADDAHRLLAELTDRPALMLGCSLGAIIGLELAVAHPEQLSTLIAHEPAAPHWLPDAERDHTAKELDEVQDAFRRDGWLAAVKKVAAVTGVDPVNQELEAGVELPPIDAARAADFTFFLAHDIDAMRGGTLALTDVAAAPTRIVPAAGGATARGVFDYRCAEELARALGVGVEQFPGGHNGNMTHPKAFAARVREVLTP